MPTKKKKTIKTVPKKRLKRSKKWNNKDKMNKQKEYKNYIEKQFNKAKEVVIIDFVKLEFNYIDQPREQRYGDMVFSIRFVKPYRRAYIHIYPASYDLYKQNRFEDLDRAVIHELCHIHTTPLTELAQDRYVTEKEIKETNEELTELICEYIVRSLHNKRSKKLKAKD